MLIHTYYYQSYASIIYHVYLSLIPTLFSSNRISMKNCVGMHLVYYPYTILAPALLSDYIMKYGLVQHSVSESPVSDLELIVRVR